MRPVDFFTALIIVVICGLSFPLSKWVVSQIPPIFVVAMRFLLLAAMIAPFLRPTRAQLRKIIPLSLVMGAGHYSLFFLGIHGLDAGTAAITIQLELPFSILLAALFLGEKVSARKIIGTAIAFVGLLFIAGRPEQAPTIPLLMSVGAAFFWAWGSIQIKKIGAINPLSMSAWLGLFAAPQLLILSFIFEEGQIAAVQAADWRAWAGFAFMVIGFTLIATTLWYRLIQRYDINVVAPFTLAIPVVGVAAGAAIMGDEITLPKVIGGSIMLAGLVVIQWRELAAMIRRPAAQPAT